MRLVNAGLRWLAIGTIVGGVTVVLFKLPVGLTVAFEAVLMVFVSIGLMIEVDHQKELSASGEKDADQVILDYVNGITIGTKPAGRLNVPHDYFMPYCVCPKCDNEALHWLEDGQLDVSDEKLMYRMGAEAEAVANAGGGLWALVTYVPPLPDYRFHREQFRDLGMSPDEIDKAVEDVAKRQRERENQRLIDKGRDIANKKNAERHVIRTCRNCGITWDQKLGWE